MTKEDLKHGNVVETREGFRYLYFKDKNNYYDDLLFNLDGKDFDKSINNYRYDLIYELGNHHLDIMKVYKDYTCQELLWERKEPIKLTEDEKVILRNLNKRFKYIVKDNDNDLYLYQEEPRKVNYGRWINDNDYESFIAYNHLFKFMTSDKPYLIEDLLKGQEDDE